MQDIIINIVLLFLSIIVGSLVFFVPLFKSKQKFSIFVKENTDILTASIILIIATISRVCLLDKIPLGINQDETSLGYDAYSLLNWGIDRNGMKYPVQLIAWGSGQNILYAYFVIPFIALLGNTEIALRLPMALVSSFSLYITYFVLRKVKDRKVALVSLFIFAIMPWHIMKSRWALESNLFPELVLQGMMLLVLSQDTRKHILFYLSAIILGLSSYSYGTSYFFLFFFIIGFLIYLLVKKYEKWYHVFFYLLTVGVICIPIMLFLYINIFDKETIHLFFFDIPKLKTDRFHSVTSLFSSEFLKDCQNNLTNGLRIILKQYDYLPWNATEIFGTMYLFTLPFSIIGLFHRSKKEILTDSLTNDKGFKTYIT